jgi:hypothetical protein
MPHGTLLLALHAARMELGEVERTGVNRFHGYAFVQAEVLFATVRPVLNKHGLIILQDVEGTPWIDDKGNTHIMFLFWVHHISGDSLEQPIRVFASGCDRDQNGNWQDKGAYKANTAAWKYFFLRLFTMDSGEHEPENDTADSPSIQPEKIPVPQPPAQAPRPTPPRNMLPPKSTAVDDRVISEVQLKNSGFWRKAMNRAEQFHGDDQSRKFYAADWACEQLGLRGVRDATVSQLRQLTELVEKYNGELPAPDGGGYEGPPF